MHTPNRLPSMSAFAVTGPKVRREGLRILLVSEHFPKCLAQSVHGIFQRLRVLLDAAGTLARVDVLFFWQTTDPFEAEDLNRRYAELATAWKVEGCMWLCRTGRLDQRHRIARNLAELPWVLRGAVSIMAGRPTMRTCRKSQGEFLRRALHELEPNLIVAHRQGAVAALRRANVSLPPVVTDMDDLEYVKLRRAASQAAGLYSRLTTGAWSLLARRAEVQGLRRSRISLVCSEDDRQRLRSLVPTADIRVLPNSIADASLLPLPDAPVALFVGNFRYPPNAEAVAWLLKQSWPRVLRAVPEARLIIAGLDGEKLRDSMPALPKVEITGFLESLAEVYAAARIVVCPVVRGGGTRIKIIEAAAYGRPVVSTTVGAEGLAFSDGREIVIRDQPDDFADACVALLLDKTASERLGQAARVVVSARYNRAGAVALASRIMREVMAASPPKAPL